MKNNLKCISDHWAVQPEPNSGCWLWNGSTHPRGYGQLSFGHRVTKAHRLAWELKNGPLPAGKMALHRCNVRCCVNPDHIYPGTAADNTADMMRAGRGHSMPGAIHPKTHLTEQDVLRIRKDYWEDGVSRKMLRETYQLSRGGLDAIIYRKSWKHI